MKRVNTPYCILTHILLVLALSSCTVSYKLNGASIDYTKTKSISIADFINTAEMVYPPFAQTFSETLRDSYTRRTRLKVIKKGGDMNLEGEIINYTLTPLAIGADSYSSQTKLSVTIKVRFTNHKNPDDDYEKSYTAFQTFDSSKMLNEVQDDLMKIIVEEISDNIYNDTVAKW